MSDARAGLLALLLIGVGCYFGFGGSLPFRDPYTVRAVVTTTAQLRPNSPVRVAGVEVGRVSAVMRGRGSTAEIELEISDRGRPIHRDATLKIRPRLFLEGNFFVDLRPGSPSAPELPDGGTLPLAQTAVPVQFDEVLSILDSESRGRLQATVSELAAALDERAGARALRATLREAPGALRGTAVVAEALRGRGARDLSRFVEAQSRLSARVAEHAVELSDLITDLRRTAGALASRSRAVQATLRSLAATVEAAPGSLARLSAVLPEVDRLTADLRPALRAAPVTLDAAVPFLEQVRALTARRELPRTLSDLRPALVRLAPLEPRLGDLFDLVTPVTDCVREQAQPVLRAVIDDGDLSTGRPVWQDLVHAMVGLASSSQNFDANGHAVRYQPGGGEHLFSTGDVPGLGRLYGLSPRPLEGVRPKWGGYKGLPPLRPDVPCRDQEPVDLRADAVPLDSRRVDVPARRLNWKRLLRRVIGAPQRRQRRRGRPARPAPPPQRPQRPALPERPPVRLPDLPKAPDVLPPLLEQLPVVGDLVKGLDR